MRPKIAELITAVGLSNEGLFRTFRASNRSSKLSPSLILKTRYLPQKMNFKPSCMVRGSRTPVTVPKVAGVEKASARVVKFVWLKMLKTSHRSCTDFDSLNLMLLARVASKRVVGGPVMTLRDSLPTRFTPAGTLAKQAVLNHCAKVLAPPEFGSQITSGLKPDGDAPSSPRPGASILAVVAVKPKPVK